MDIEGVTAAVRHLAERGCAAFRLTLADGTGVDVPMGEDNAALTFADRDGWVTFSTGGQSRTAPILLDDVVAVREVRG